MDQQIRLHRLYRAERRLRGQRVDFADCNPPTGAECSEGAGWTGAVRGRAAVIRSAGLLLCTTAAGEAPGDSPDPFLLEDLRETGAGRPGGRVFHDDRRRNE